MFLWLTRSSRLPRPACLEVTTKVETVHPQELSEITFLYLVVCLLYGTVMTSKKSPINYAENSLFKIE